MAKDAGKSLGDAQTRLRESEQLKSGLDTARSLGDSQTLIGGLAADAGELNDGLELTDLLARYTIIKTLGQGGMGEVLLATDNRLKRQVAIKRIRGEQAKSRAAVQRFLTEAQAIAALNHPNIVQVYDYGRDQEGPFLIMEYVDGQSLLDCCKDNPLPVDEAVELTCELLGGLGRAHELGIVHRDIKPANILLTKDGRPKLTDFGLAKQTAADHGQTVAGAVLGTIDFMPPEQRRDATLVDARSDLWSLAATLYQMLTGKSPKVIRLDLLPKQLVGVLSQALEESPAQRFQSAAAFRDALRGSNQTETLGASELIAGQCPQCGTRNSETVRFCRECSAALKVPCLGCEAEIPIWDKGCTECGARQADLFERKRGEFQKLQTEVERLREAGKVSEALRRLESVGEVKHPRLQDFRHWVERAFPDLREQAERLVKLSIDALAEARAHRAAWDYQAATRTLKSIPPEAMREEHKQLLVQLQADWTELQQKLQEIQQRVKAKQLDGLLPLVERAVELRGNREDLKKLLGQLQQREAMLAANSPTPSNDPLSDPFETSTGSVTLPGFLEKAKSQQTVLQQRGPLIAAAAGGLLLLLFFGWLFSRGGGSADSASTTEKIASANRPGVLAPKQSSEVSQSANASAKQVAPLSKTTPSNTSPASPFFSRRSNSDKAGSKENLNSIGMKLKLVPAGSFTMGTGADAHQVTLTKPFYLGAYEVTTDQYAKVMGKGAVQDSRDLPMAYVSWEEATEFCRKLSELPEEKKAGRVYRLPTEAEWEYACRAGTTTKYCNGDSQWDLANYAWFEANSSVKTHAVGTKKANAWGFYDMHGNVWEWCYDLYGEYPKGAVTDPTGPVRGKDRVLRGGSWSVTAEKCASAYRDSNLPSSQFFTYGFRVAVTLPEEGK